MNFIVRLILQIIYIDVNIIFRVLFNRKKWDVRDVKFALSDYADEVNAFAPDVCR